MTLIQSQQHLTGRLEWLPDYNVAQTHSHDMTATNDIVTNSSYYPFIKT